MDKQETLLTEILQELRQNNDMVEHLQDIAADIYGLVKEISWDRDVW